MFQHGFSGRTDREALPERLGDPLPKTDRVVDRDGFRGELVRTIGLARARFKIGMMNLVYNIRRLGWLGAHP